jgi:hypothetical protein
MQTGSPLLINDSPVENHSSQTQTAWNIFSRYLLNYLFSPTVVRFDPSKPQCSSCPPSFSSALPLQLLLPRRANTQPRWPCPRSPSDRYTCANLCLNLPPVKRPVAQDILNASVFQPATIRDGGTAVARMDVSHLQK